jgi:acetyl esterase
MTRRWRASITSTAAGWGSCCVSGLKRVIANAARLGIDPGRVVVAGESDGGNLTLAAGLKLKQDGELGLISGLYAMAPFIRGQWPAPDCPSSIENNGILVISVNECDPLRDEGVNFYRLLLAAGIPARCRQVIGMHAVEAFTTVCPEISRHTARDLAAFCRG